MAAYMSLTGCPGTCSEFTLSAPCVGASHTAGRGPDYLLQLLRDVDKNERPINLYQQTRSENLPSAMTRAFCSFLLSHGC